MSEKINILCACDCGNWVHISEDDLNYYYDKYGSIRLITKNCEIPDDFELVVQDDVKVVKVK